MGILDKVQSQIEMEHRKFLAYEAVRYSGKVNMNAIREVCDITGLDRAEVMHIRENYQQLAEKYLS